MPRLGLTFISKNYARHDCADFKDYMLASNQFVEALGEPINYLVCEPRDFKSKELKIVIMVAQKLEIKDSNKSLSRTNFSSQREPEIFDEDFSKKIVFFNIKDDGTLEPKDRIARFYLVLRYLWQQKYDDAKELLDSNASYLSKFTKQEEDILDQIIAGNSIDHDVRALAIRLLAFYVKAQNNLISEGEYVIRERDQKPTRGVFEEYINKLNTVTSSFIDKNIEFKIAQFLRYYDEKYFNGVYPNKFLSKNIVNRLSYLADKEILHDNIYANKFSPKIRRKKSWNDLNKEENKQLFITHPIFQEHPSDGRHKEKYSSPKSLLDAVSGQIITQDNYSIFFEILLLDENTEIDPELRSKALEFINSFMSEKGITLSDKEIINEVSLLVNKAFIMLNKIEANQKGQFDEATGNKVKLLYYLTQMNDKKEFKNIRAQHNTICPISLNEFSFIMQGSFRTQDFSLEKLENWLITKDLFDKLIADANKFYENYSFQEPKQEFIEKSIELEVQAKTRAPKYKRRLVTPLFVDINSKINITDPLDGKDINNIEEEIQKIKNSVKNDEVNILNLARKYDPKQIDANYYELLKIADIEKQIEIKDIIYLLLTNKLEDFYAINGSITAHEAILLKDYVISYLLNATYLSYLQKAKVGLALPNMKRSYDYSNNIEYLVFEYFMDILIRPNQKQALDDLGIKDGKIANFDKLGALIELIMGAGKTSVIAPLIAAITSDTNWLTMIVLPESLITSMSEELSQTLSKSFKKHLDIIDFNIYGMNTIRLKSLKEILLKAKKQGRSIVTTNSSIQGFFLNIVNDFETKSVDEEKYKDLLEIIKLFKEHTRVSIDEIDLALDVMKAKQIAAGNKVQLPEIIQKTVSNFYKLLASEADIYENYSLSFLPYSNAKPLTKDSFAEFKKLVVDKIFLSPLFDKYIENNNNKEKLKEYLLNPNMDNYKEMINNTDNEDSKSVFAVLSEELNSVF